MDTTTLGRTGIEVSVAGLGCGGHSRLGQTYGRSVQESVAVVRAAIDAGVTFIDTARAYRTEEIVGAAIRGRRDDVVVSSKAWIQDRDGLIGAEALRDSVHKSLRRLGTECIDVFHLHGVPDAAYDHCRAELVPELVRLKEAGTIRAVAVSERFAEDPGHTMLARALEDGIWDVVMVGFNILNPSARHRVLARCRADDIGVLGMFAVRRALSRTDALAQVVAELVADGHLEAGAIDPADPLEFVRGEGAGHASSVVEAAYRFVRHEPGMHVTLTGTGSIDHLHENLAAIGAPPLGPTIRERLDRLFGGLDHLSAE